MPGLGQNRPDVAFCPSVPDHSMLQTSTHAVINGAQKPTCIAEMFVHDLTRGGPDSTVLVLGSGSGSEIIGALKNGNSVVAFEKCHTQFKAGQTRLEAALGYHNTILPAYGPDEIPQSLVTAPDPYMWEDVGTRHFNQQIPQFNTAEALKLAQKEHKQRMRLVKQSGAQEESGEEKQQKEVRCYVCGLAVRDDDRLFTCQRCQSVAHEACQDGDGTHCLDCGTQLDDSAILAAQQAGGEPSTPPLAQDTGPMEIVET